MLNIYKGIHTYKFNYYCHFKLQININKYLYKYFMDDDDDEQKKSYTFPL